MTEHSIDWKEPPYKSIMWNRIRESFTIECSHSLCPMGRIWISLCLFLKSILDKWGGRSGWYQGWREKKSPSRKKKSIHPSAAREIEENKRGRQSSDVKPVCHIDHCQKWLVAIVQNNGFILTSFLMLFARRGKKHGYFVKVISFYRSASRCERGVMETYVWYFLKYWGWMCFNSLHLE